ncbi:MAG: hypothetical protein Q7U73_14230 [Rubrivivax sp.]|nr:hypothetical protein [Rubrivivax sp.]
MTLRRSLPPALLMALALTGCALVPQPPQPGAPRAEVLGTWGAPTAYHAMPDGSERLEYASGPYGRTTWMVDLDASGRVRQARQVLNEAEFEAVMSIRGLRRAGVLRHLGAPGERRPMGWLGGEIWSWRYPTNDCLWFEVSLSTDGRVTGAGYAVDPTCDAPPDRE